ncbi:hypothetical protein [Brevibacillus nitrificans]|uniref:hypothetical protein n=1 Tax=Brevibacillus nitrificans TaxID=651560 RepID=UPI00285A5BEE|nr:hypothetical protein [Brevibacillus nitrificans]MDR7317300.1 hypothetical protein [Brevibacillus nitrificans]
MRKGKAAKRGARARYTRAARRSVVNARRPLRVHVRAPKVHVTTPAPLVTVAPATPTVQVEAPSVNIQAPKPIVIPAPIVQVEVESEESADEISLQGIRKELTKCMKKNQTIELLLASDWGPENRPYRVGNLVRVDEGILELQTLPSLHPQAARILIPLNRIVALIPDLVIAEELETSDEEGLAEEGETISLEWNESVREEDDQQLASG